MPKNSFLLYCDMYDSIRPLTVEQKAQLLDAIFMFHRNEPLYGLDPVVEMCFSFLSRAFERDRKKYEQLCEKNRKNVSIRWNKSNTTVYDRIRPDTKNTDTDLKAFKDNCLSLKSLPQSQENAFPQVGGETPGSPVGSLNESKTAKFVPPSLEEVSEYLQSKGSSIDAEAFHAFYESKGWMVGKSKMKNWKAAVRTWEAHRRPRQSADTSWHKYREWEKRYLERRGAIYSANQEPTTESVDAAAKVIRSLIGPEEYTEPMVADAIAWLLEVPERCRNVPTLATLMDDLQGWGRVITWASNGARGGNVPDDPWGKMF